MIDEGCGDAGELRRDLQTRDEDGRARFPMLRGLKVGPMWIRIMANPDGAVIDRIETITVAVDVQVRRATENLGVTAALDPALWFFGRHGCGHCEREGEKVSFGRACDHCVRFSRS
ncbi:hypothetical protein [Candidatus Palauibacter sp.]|uniref:hypothetical protein n=1 Tax=Candidatus Palauibacter sp. TaxID=3101350 RepID=UPI003C6FD435